MKKKIDVTRVVNKALLEARKDDIAAEKRDLLALFLEEIFDWSSRFHIIGRHSPEKNISLQLLDSLLLTAAIEGNCAKLIKKSGVRLADIGSGAGFPGIIYKILHPETVVYLFERRQKLALFLERIANLLALSEVYVREEAAYARKSSFDVITAKAAGRLEYIAPIAEKLLVRGGIFATLKGKSWKDELESLSPGHLRYSSTVELEQGRGYILFFARA